MRRAFSIRSCAGQLTPARCPRENPASNAATRRVEPSRTADLVPAVRGSGMMSVKSEDYLERVVATGKERNLSACRPPDGR